MMLLGSRGQEDVSVRSEIATDYANSVAKHKRNKVERDLSEFVPITSVIPYQTLTKVMELCSPSVTRKASQVYTKFLINLTLTRFNYIWK